MIQSLLVVIGDGVGKLGQREMQGRGETRTKKSPLTLESLLSEEIKKRGARVQKERRATIESQARDNLEDEVIRGEEEEGDALLELEVGKGRFHAEDVVRHILTVPARGNESEEGSPLERGRNSTLQTSECRRETVEREVGLRVRVRVEFAFGLR